MNINDLFCTPDQGRRLKELVPSLRPSMVWANFGDDNLIPWVAVNHESTLRAPALTLQELRDVAKEHLPASDLITKFQPYLYNMTAPKLADWIIDRLEATP